MAKIKSGKNQYVAPRGNKWIAGGDGNKRATRVVDTQKEAISIARQIAKNQQSELTIRGVDGKIRDKRSYGNDPYPPKGYNFNWERFYVAPFYFYKESEISGELFAISENYHYFCYGGKIYGGNKN